MPFAPRTIQIRYGNDGLLGAAAAALGTAQRREADEADYNARVARDMQFINAEMDRREAGRQFNAQNQLQARQLQQAHQLALARLNAQPNQTPTSRPSLAAATPFSQHVQAAKSLALQSGLAGVDVPEEQRVLLEALANDPNVDSSQFSRMLNDVTGRVTKAKQRDDQAQAKAAYFESIQARIPEQERQALQALATSPDVSLAQLRVAADNSLSRNTIRASAATDYQVRGIEAEARQVRDRMEDITRMLAKQGYSPEMTPAELNPTYADPDASRFNTFGFGGAIGDAFTGSGQLVSGGDPDAMSQLILHAQLKRQLATLEAQRQAVLQQATQTQPAQQRQAAPQPAPQVDPRQLSDDELLRLLSQ